MSLLIDVSIILAVYDAYLGVVDWSTIDTASLREFAECDDDERILAAVRAEIERRQ